MSQVKLHNATPVQQSVIGNDGQAYFLAPRKVSELPEGVTYIGTLPQGVTLVH